MRLLNTAFIIFVSSLLCFGQDDLSGKKSFSITGYNFFLELTAKKQWEEIAKEVIQRGHKDHKYDPVENVYLLFVGIKDANEMQIVHKNKNGLTDRILDKENIYILWIDDEAKDDYEISYEIKKRASSLEKDFSSMKSWLTGFKDDAEKTRGSSTVIKYYTNLIKLKGVVSPADINVSISVSNDGKSKYASSFSYINHEVSYFGIALGVTAAKGTEKNFLIKDKQLYFSDNAKNDWQGKFMLGFNFHIPRDVDSFDPSAEIWTGEFWRDFHKRLNLFVGFELSSRPFDGLFAGLGLNITKDIQLNFGSMFVNNIQLKQGDSVGDINSISDVKNFFPKKYESKFYIGLNFSTVMVSKMLGFGS